MAFPDTTFTTGTTITSNWLNAVNDICNDVQGYLSVKSFGALGDGSTDDTAAIQAAVTAAAGKQLYVPKGTYMIDEITISNVVSIVCDPEAVFKLRTGVAGQNTQMFTVEATAVGTSFIGGVLDGNRTAFTYPVSYIGPTKGWQGIVVLADYVTIKDCTFQNWVDVPLYWKDGDYGYANNLKFVTCGFGPNFGPHYSEGTEAAYSISNLCVDGVYIIGSTNLSTVQITHAIDVNRTRNSTISNVFMYQLSGTSASASAWVSGLTAHNCWKTNFTNIYASDFNTTQLKHLCMSILSCESCVFTGLNLSGFNHGGLEVLTCYDCQFNDSVIDGEYVSNAASTTSYGLRLSPGGVGYQNYNRKALTSEINTVFNNVRVQRCTGGAADIKASGFTFNDCQFIGNLQNGVYAIASNESISGFTQSFAPRAVAKMINCVSQFNGGNGATFNGALDIEIDGGVYNNNATSGIQLNAVTKEINALQRTSNVLTVTTDTSHQLSPGQMVYIAASTSGITNYYTVVSVPNLVSFTVSSTGADFGPASDTGNIAGCARLRISDVTACDTQGSFGTGAPSNGSQSFACSYKPGTSDANNRFVVTLFNNVNYNVGQSITIDGNTGYFYDFNDDEATIQFAAPVTMGEVTLGTIGNITSSGTTITSDTNIQNLLVGPAWIKVAGQWRQIQYMTGTNTAVIDQAFSPEISSPTAGQWHQANIGTSKTQDYGVFTTAASVAPVYIKNNKMYDNLVQDIRIGGSKYDQGSEIYSGLSTATVSGSSAYLSLFTTDVLVGARPVALYIKVTTTFTTATSAQVVFRDTGTSTDISTEDVTITALTAGDITRIALKSPPVNQTGIRIFLKFNTAPGAGAVSSLAMFENNLLLPVNP